MIRIPLPRLLNRETLAFERRIRPVKACVELHATPLSTASIQLQENDTLPARSYVEMFTVLGSAGIYRVRSPQNSYGDENVSVSELEHAVTEVGDWIVKEEINEQMAPAQAMQRIFQHYRGNKWQLGDLSALGSDQVAVQVNRDILLQAMLAILDQVPDCIMDFDFSVTPWKINFIKRDSQVSAEGRLSRNVSSAKIIYDDSALCTRAYYEYSTETSGSMDGVPTFNPARLYSAGSYVQYQDEVYVLTEGHTPGVVWAETVKSKVTNIPSTNWAYIDADTIGTWGIVEREVPTGMDYSNAEALRVASDYIRKHKNPKISIEITGLELSARTGESIDHFRIGKLFRLALPKHGITVQDCIVGLVFDDVYGRPYDVDVSLASEEDTAVAFMHEVAETGGSVSAGGGRKKQDDVWKEFRTDIEKTDMYMDLWARRYNQAEEILQQAGLYIDVNGTLLYADDFENNLGSKFRVTTQLIESEVTNRQNADGELSSRISQTANQILQSVDNDVENLSGRISLTDRRAAMAVGTAYDDAHRRPYKNMSEFPETGTAGYLYVDNSTGYFYKWEGGQYVRTTDDLAIKAGEICIAINQSGESTAKLDADRILAGRNLETTLADLELPDWMDTTEGLIAEKATIVNLNALAARVGTLETDTLKTESLYSAISNLDTGRVKKLSVASGGNIKFEGNNIIFTDSTAANIVTNLKIELNSSTNTYTLSKYTLDGGGGWTPVGSFSRATSLSGAWSGGTYTVTASPQGKTKSTTLDSWTVSGNPWVCNAAGAADPNGKYVARVFIINDSDGNSTGFSDTFVIPASAVYDNGYNDATGSYTLSDGTLEITKSTNGSAFPLSFELTAGVSYDTTTHQYTATAYVDGTSAATKKSGVEAYNAGWIAGWNQARAKVTRSGNTIKRPKVATTASDPGTENFTTATAHNGTLSKGSAWGKAKSQYRVKTPGGTSGWDGEKSYEVVGSYKVSSSITVEYRSTGGYWGWNTEPSVGSPSITWST